MGKVILVILSVLIVSLGSGCATVFSGYQTNVDIKNLPDSLHVNTTEGLELPTKYTHEIDNPVHESSGIVYHNEIVDSTYRTVQLRGNRDYVLIFKSKNTEYHYAAYAKINGWWLTLDIICGGVPFIIDAITGNWNYYDSIIFQEKVKASN